MPPVSDFSLEFFILNATDRLALARRSAKVEGYLPPITKGSLTELEGELWFKQPAETPPRRHTPSYKPRTPSATS